MPSIPNPLELAQQLIRLDTRNPPGDEHKAADLLADLLEPAGFAIERRDMAPGRTNLLASIGPEEDALCLSGHLDTVPLGQCEWSFDPLCGEVRDGNLLGRGSSDMKAGVAALVVAALRLADSDLRRGLRLVLTAGEENSLEGSQWLEREGLLGRAGAVVVAEPTALAPFCGHKGVMWLRGLATGRTAHGSMPELGDNAVLKAARCALALENLASGRTHHPVLGPTTLSVNALRGGEAYNVVPDHAELRVDVRLSPGEDVDGLLEEIRSACGSEVVITARERHDPLWTAPDHPFARMAANAAAEVLGYESETAGASYFTDASVLKRAYGGAPTIILGPGLPEQAHQPNEYCPAANVELCADIFERLARAWCIPSSA